MRQLVFALAALVLLPGVADARYIVPPVYQVLGGSSVIVVGEVQAVGANYTVNVTQQLVGPKDALSGAISVVARGQSRRCVPQDPEGVVVGSTWVWVLEPTGENTYRSWVSAPFQVKDGRVLCSKLTPLGTRPATVETFCAMIKEYRRCFRLGPHGAVTRIATPVQVEAFAASSPYARALLQHMPQGLRR